MGSPSWTESLPNSRNPNFLILISLTLILTFYISKRTENNSSSLLMNYRQKLKRKTKLKTKINNILLSGLGFRFWLSGSGVVG